MDASNWRKLRLTCRIDGRQDHEAGLRSHRGLLKDLVSCGFVMAYVIHGVP